MSADVAIGTAEQARRLLESAPISVAIVTEDGRYLYRNPAHDALYGYAPGDVPALSRTPWVDPAVRERLLDTFRTTGELRDAERLVAQHVRDDAGGTRLRSQRRRKGALAAARPPAHEDEQGRRHNKARACLDGKAQGRGGRRRPRGCVVD